MTASETESVSAAQDPDVQGTLGVHTLTDPAIWAESDDAHQTEGRGPVVSPPGLLQRVLLTTDGSVGRILENYAGEAIDAIKLDQFRDPAGDPCYALDLAADEERLTRRVLLRGSQSGSTFLYAETLIALDKLHPFVRSGLLSTAEPIGRLLTTARLETFRDILSSGRVPAEAIAQHFGIAEDDELFVRTYRIICGGRPIMLITEMFPTTWFC